ncbi:HD domain-containing phosphohydrolase [uncultured Desulfobulbus sp.]|uniref:HD domain-containing phosphohydrolase n=1 Tax=uncultured Desulfobulbus sp. TaxID=239745 RepID=UPI0029C7AE13|nr:HD domain-containing phosphohydrolase [uncultured Desulfobulbus sp.]
MDLLRSPCKLFLITLLVLLAALQTDVPAGDTRPRPRVLVLHSYAPDFSWTRDLHAGIVSVLQTSEVQARYRVEYMDAKHHSSPTYLERLLALYREKYTGSHFDGIILTDDHALNLVAQYREELFPQTPVVACGINDPKSLPANVGDMNIIIERLAHQETLDAALHQNPETRKIFVAVDGTLSGQAILQDFLEQVPLLTNRVEVEILPAMTRDALLEFAGERKQGELIYLLVYFQDAAGQVFGAEEIPKAIAAASPVPVYVAWDFQMDSGAVGGCVTSAFGHGQKAAQTLLERLAGNSPPALYDKLLGVNRHTYNYTALQRFGIPLSSLPENSLLLNRPLSYFEVHRSAILTALAIIAILSVIIALLIQNVLRQRKINLGNAEILALNREVIETQLELLSTLGEVIETRSQDTANHVRRVAAYSALLGQKYGLAQEDIVLLEAASPMHDVGKIGIPDAILHKPGKLTPEEFEIIKHHTVIGQRILHMSDRKLMVSARTIALQHHERWDGTGYPCGLKGEEISLLARISALADVYDALSLGRVYKEAWPKEKVLQFIRQERGGMFDPQIVDLFFEHLEELEAIKLRLSDPVRMPKSEEIVGPVHCPTRES